jgi:hypothetical protein
MTCDARLYRRRYSQSLMHAAEIVVHEIERDGPTVILNLLRECVCEPRKTTHSHPHGQILALNVARGNMLGIRVADDRYYSAFIVCCISSVRRLRRAQKQKRPSWSRGALSYKDYYTTF